MDTKNIAAYRAAIRRAADHLNEVREEIINPYHDGETDDMKAEPSP